MNEAAVETALKAGTGQLMQASNIDEPSIPRNIRLHRPGSQDGTDALAIAGEYKGQIDLMITNVVMPQMGGTRLAGELAAERRPNMKVLFVSGYAETTVSATARSK